jgi:hypothetical protein
VIFAALPAQHFELTRKALIGRPREERPVTISPKPLLIECCTARQRLWIG